MPKTEEPEFAVNEKILCFHGPLIYEAKVLKLEKREKEWYYFIHYQGWSKNWDEFVPESRVLKYTDENVKRQHEHEKAVKKTPKSGKGGKSQKGLTPGKKGSGSITGESTSSTTASTTTESRPSSPVPEEKPSGSKKPKTAGTPSSLEPPSKRTKNDATKEVESEDKFLAKQEIKIELPEKLKMLLVDDWDFVTRQRKLVTIPGRYSVDKLLKEFEESYPTNLSLGEYASGIKLYFNVMLGSQLLYRFERGQYGDILAKEKKGKTEAQFAENPTQMSSLYGPVHLMRFFTKLGPNLAFTKIGSNDLQEILGANALLFEFLETNFDKYFKLSEDYCMSDPVYQRKAPV